jgi:hypothetical protein
LNDDRKLLVDAHVHEPATITKPPRSICGGYKSLFFDAQFVKACWHILKRKRSVRPRENGWQATASRNKPDPSLKDASSAAAVDDFAEHACGYWGGLPSDVVRSDTQHQKNDRKRTN